MPLFAFLLVSPVLVFGGSSPEPTATAATAIADESVEVLIIRSSCSFFRGYPTSGCLDSDTLTMKSCSEANNPHGKSDCQKKCGSFHLNKVDLSPEKARRGFYGYCTLRVRDDHDAAYLSIGQDVGASVAKLQKKTDPYIWQSSQYVGLYLSWFCNKVASAHNALCVTDSGGLSSKSGGGNVWLARYDNGEQINCI